MALQPYSINVASFTDSDAGGNNYYANKEVKIFQVSGGLATIYSDSGGLSPIAQDGVANVTDARGEFFFYIASGDYYAQADGYNKYFSILKKNDYLTVQEVVDDAGLGVGEIGRVLGVGDFEIESSNPNGYYLATSNGFLKPLMAHASLYGVEADGATDDTDALQNAHDDSMTVLGPKPLILPDGTIMIDSFRVNYQGSKIHGQGQKATILKANDATVATDLINMTGDYSWCEFADMTIDGNRDNVVALDCFNWEASSFNGYGVLKNLEIRKFNGTACKFKNSNATSLIDVSIARVYYGISVERTTPLHISNVDIGKFTKGGFIFNGTPSQTGVVGTGLYMEASVDTPDAGAPFIQFNNIRDFHYFNVSGVYMNGNFNTQAFDTTGIEIANPLAAKNITIQGNMTDVKTPLLFTGVADSEVEDVDLTKLHIDSDSGTPTRQVGVRLEDSYSAVKESKVFDLSGSGETVPLFSVNGERPVRINQILWVYPEATSADAGVTLRVGLDTDIDYFTDDTSEVSSTAYQQVESTLINATNYGTDYTVTVRSAGSKVGAGEAYAVVDYTVY